MILILQKILVKILKIQIFQFKMLMLYPLKIKYFLQIHLTICQKIKFQIKNPIQEKLILTNK